MKKMMVLMATLFVTGGAMSAHAEVYSEAVTAGDFLYVSGQVPIDPDTGKMVDGDMNTVTNLVIDHIQHWLHVKGFTMRQVVKTQVFLTDSRDFDGMNAAYAERFHFAHPPARDVVVVPGLINNARLQISCVAKK